MKFYAAVTSLAFLSSALARNRTFTIYNSCSFTIWPAIYSGLPQFGGAPYYPTGWEAPAFTSVSFPVPDQWRAGRIWARRNCNFTNNSGPNSCLTGGCNGGLVCNPNTGTGVPPATLAEWNLNISGKDNYDISIVDGFNLPMRITNSKGCPVAECAADLNVNCPGPLKGPFDSTGFPVGCKSACLANVDGNPGNSANCCTGSHSTPATCPASGVAYYSYFKGNCPRTSAYAYDEPSGTAQFTCDVGVNSAADYTLTFCPQ